MTVSIRIAGRTYPISKRAAAKAFGISPNLLSTRIRRGTKALNAPIDARRMPYPKPVVVGKRRYHSQMSAAKAYGLNFQTVSERIKRGIPLKTPIRTGRPRSAA